MKELLDKKNVIGYYKDGDKIHVLVEKKQPLEELEAKDIIPSTFDSIKTDVIQSDIPQAHYYEDRIQGSDPFMAGIAIRGSETGTAGLIFEYEGKHYVLTNSHVGAGIGSRSKGSGLYETKTGRTLASLEAGSVIKTFPDYPEWIDMGRPIAETDACFALMTAIHEGCRVLGLPYPKGIRRPLKGMKVALSGRTSSVSRGEITLTNMTLTARYKSGLGIVGNTFKALRDGKGMAQAGDSGACYFDEEGYVVGIHYAGDSNGSYGVDIIRTFEELGLDVDKVTFPSRPIEEPTEENPMFITDKDGREWRVFGTDNAAKGEGAGNLFDGTNKKALFRNGSFELIPQFISADRLRGITYTVANDTDIYPIRSLTAIQIKGEEIDLMVDVPQDDKTPYAEHYIKFPSSVDINSVTRIIFYSNPGEILQIAELGFDFVAVEEPAEEPVEEPELPGEPQKDVYEVVLLKNGIEVNRMTY